MITDLSIRNFALIENSELTFSPGLNILSGETGAVQSILIDALSVLLGNRASLEQISTGMNEASVSATITLDNNKDIYNYLENYDISKPNQKTNYINSCLNVISKLESDSERSIYLDILKSIANVPTEILRKDMANLDSASAENTEEVEPEPCTCTWTDKTVRQLKKDERTKLIEGFNNGVDINELAEEL